MTLKNNTIPPDRAEWLRQSIMENMLRPKKAWRAMGTLWDVFPDAEDMPLIVRHALAVKKKFSEVPITIWPFQLIAGSYILPESDMSAGGGRLPDFATAEEKKEAAKRGYSVGSIVGHIVPSYPKLLRKGALGIRDDAVKLGGTAKDEDSRAFYKACEIVMDALAVYAKRHADLCRSLAENELPERAAELRQMADDLDVAPLYPAKTFRQAVAAIWLTHLAFQLTGNELAIGRFDQHTGSYLDADLKSGEITLKQASELVDCFMLKFNERSLDNGIPRANADFEGSRARNEEAWAKRSPFAHTTQRFNLRDSIDSTNHWLQNVIIGGVRPEDGSDACNLVTYMVLDAFEKNRMTNPCLTVRLHSGTPEQLLRRSCEVLREGGGLPAFFNDEAIIPGLVKWGFELEDARDYTNDGCWEIIIAGRNDFYFDRFNMLRCLEWALNNGKSRIDGKNEAPDLGDPGLFASYSDVYDAFLKELSYELEGLMAKNESQFGARHNISPVPLLSALLDGPMEFGGDMTQRGAKYITYGLLGEGMSHVIDSLCAIKKVIFDDRDAAMTELIEALDANFNGYEALRKKLMAAPKYGRGEKEADETGKALVKDFAEITASLNPKYPKIKYLPGAGTFSWYIAIGEGLGASPDGRLSGEAVSSNMSPSAGAATRGVTGAILSHAAFSRDDLPVGAPTDLRISSRQVAGEDGLKRLTGIVKSFVTLGGNMMTLTVADTEILRLAQANPEQYRDLRVRMGGWSAYFTMLSKEQQEYHISKQEDI